MLYYGVNITQTGDKLHPLPVADLHRRLQQPKLAIAELIANLRILQTVDASSYGRLKKTLPYLVCGHFNPPVRRKEHFASIQYFFLDLDHISVHHNLEELRARLCADEEVLLLFASPGGDGLKLLFRLQNPCSDAGLYAIFYKLFVAAFAGRHGLQQVIDGVTSDVSRACFISVDPHAWLRPEALPVKLEAYVQAGEADRALEAAEEADNLFKTLKEETAGSPKPVVKPSLEADVLLAIRKKLNGDARVPRPQKQHMQPPQLDEVLPQLRSHLEALGMILTEAEPIHFGKKLRITAGNLFAEINLFFGGRGFSVVQTTRSGSNKELCGLAAEALKDSLAALPQNP